MRIYSIGFDAKEGVFHDEELSKFLFNKEIKHLKNCRDKFSGEFRRCYPPYNSSL